MTGRSLRIAVVTPLPVSGAEGGNERHFRSLTTALNEAGHRAELVGLVSPEADLTEVLTSYRMFHELDVSWADVVVSGKYPSFMVRHPRHVRHLNHTLRGLYEHYPAHLPTEVDPTLLEGLDACGDDVGSIVEWALDACGQRAGDPQLAFPGPFARSIVQRLDRIGRDRLAAEATVSEVVAARPGYVDPDRCVTVIPPLGDLRPSEGTDTTAEDDTGGDSATESGPYLFTFGRLDGPKRFDLAMRAFEQARRLPGMSGVELVIAGDGPLRHDLQASAPPGVRFTGRLTDRDLQEHLRRARAVILTPIDEDYGLVAAEAMAAGAPIVTTTDSGGIAEQVTHGVTGLVVAPRTPLLAAAMRKLATDPALSARLGRAGHDAVAGRSWAPMLELVAEVAADDERPRALLVSTFGAEWVSNGGQRRLRGMAQGLTAHGWQVTVLSLGTDAAPGMLRRRRTHDGVHHVAVGRSAAHLAADFEMSTIVGVPVDDIACGELWNATPQFREELEALAATSDVVVASHPFLLPAIVTCGVRRPLVYDAYNVEAELKADLLRGRPGASWFVERATEAEATALERCDLLAATSANDLARLQTMSGRHMLGVIAPNPLDGALVSPRTAAEQRGARKRLLADLDRADDRRPLIVFVGSDHPPNRAAAALAVQLAAARPDLHVVIAGTVSVADPHPATLVGPFPVDDLRRLQAMADVIINPVTEGSGTSLKLVDPLALGIPVVSTWVGARGIADADEVLWLADPDPHAIGAAIDRAMIDDVERSRRITNARAIGERAAPAAAMSELAAQMTRLVRS